MEGDGDQQDGEKKDDGKKQEETPNPVPNDVEIASQLQQQFLSEYSNYQSGSANPPFPANPPPPGSVSADVNAVLDSLGMGPQNPPPQSAYPPANLGPAPVTTPASSFGANDVELAKSLIESLAHGLLSFFKLAYFSKFGTNKHFFLFQFLGLTLFPFQNFMANKEGQNLPNPFLQHKRKHLHRSKLQV